MTYELKRDNAAKDVAVIRDALGVLREVGGGINEDATIRLTALADSIEEQVKPAIEEPAEFTSVIRAKNSLGMHVLWQRSPMHGKHYWMSELGAAKVWSELTDVEVLRVGLGDDRPLQVLVEDAQREAFTLGQRDMAAGIHYRLQKLLTEAITSERKNAYEKAIQAVEELAP